MNKNISLHNLGKLFISKNYINISCSYIKKNNVILFFEYIVFFENLSEKFNWQSGIEFINSLAFTIDYFKNEIFEYLLKEGSGIKSTKTEDIR